MSRDLLDTLFKQYEESFNKFDTAALSGYCADTFMSFSPRGVISKNKAEYIEEAAQAGNHYRDLGRNSAKIISSRIMPICDKYTMVVIRWGLTFQQTGSRLMEFDMSYIVFEDDPAPKLILLISHYDEAELIRKMRILQG